MLDFNVNFCQHTLNKRNDLLVINHDKWKEEEFKKSLFDIENKFSAGVFLFITLKFYNDN
jgi:hypothetical protein